VDAVELDVRMTADGELVVIHDATLDRTTTGTGAVVDQTGAYIRSLGVRGASADTHVPSLEDVLHALGRRTGVEVELKDADPAAADILCRTLAGMRHVQALISSFDADILTYVRTRSAEVPTGLETEGTQALQDALEMLRRSPHDYLLVDVEAALHAGPELVAEAASVGARLGVWTVDRPDVQTTLFGWGVDAIETDVPEVAVETRGRLRG